MDNIWTLSFYSFAMMMLGVALTNLVSLIIRMQDEKKDWINRVNQTMRHVVELDNDVSRLIRYEQHCIRKEKEIQENESKDQ